MASKKYTLEDYGSCRWILENRTQGMRAPIDNTGALTVTQVQRLRLLNLVDGAPENTQNAELVRLAGLGVKTAEEAVRLGYPANVDPTP